VSRAGREPAGAAAQTVPVWLRRPLASGPEWGARESPQTPSRRSDEFADDDCRGGAVVHYKDFEIPPPGTVAVYAVQMYADGVLAEKRGEYLDRNEARGAALRMDVAVPDDDMLLIVGALLLEGPLSGSSVRPEIV
jgi:hypothetical protein